MIKIKIIRKGSNAEKVMGSEVMDSRDKILDQMKAEVMHLKSFMENYKMLYDVYEVSADFLGIATPMEDIEGHIRV